MPCGRSGSPYAPGPGRELQLSELEDRVLFSAVPAALLPQTVDAAPLDAASQSLDPTAGNLDQAATSAASLAELARLQGPVDTRPDSGQSGNTPPTDAWEGEAPAEPTIALRRRRLGGSLALPTSAPRCFAAPRIPLRIPAPRSLPPFRIPHSAFRIPPTPRSLPPFRIPHSAFRISDSPLASAVPHSAFRIPHSSGSPLSVRHELVFVDTSVPDYQQLLEDCGRSTNPAGNWRWCC